MEGGRYSAGETGNIGISEGVENAPSHTASSWDEKLTPEAATDTELAAVVAAWPDLPPALQAGIVAMVKAATPKIGGDKA